MDNSIHRYSSTIMEKLRQMQKKMTLSYRSAPTPEKRTELQNYISILEGLIRKVESTTITWDDLKKIGISRKIIQHEAYSAQLETFEPQHFDDFKIISKIPMEELIDSKFVHAEKVNILYSIIEYINNNYQTIFTQKSLMNASKTNSIREAFYMQYQNIFHIFHSYKSFTLIPSNSEDHMKMIEKEYLHLIKDIYKFFISILNYIESISQDETFTLEDFLTPIQTSDVSCTIRGLTLQKALETCREFVEESISYIQQENRDTFDYMSLERDMQSRRKS